MWSIYLSMLSMSNCQIVFVNVAQRQVASSFQAEVPQDNVLIETIRFPFLF